MDLSSHAVELLSGPRSPSEPRPLRLKLKPQSYPVPVVRCQLVRDGAIEAASDDCSAPGQVYELVRAHIGAADREHLVALFLSARHRVIAVHTVSIGTLTASLVHPREVFKPAILANAAGVIVAHNHPSGDCRPSPEDRAATSRLTKAGKLLGIPLMDHVIVSDGGYFSFREDGALSE